MTTTTVMTKPASTVLATVIATAFAPGSTTANAAGVSTSKTMTGKTPVATNIGWVITGVTNRLIARDMNGVIAEPTATTTAATEIAMTTAGAIATGDSGIEERVAGCPILTSRTLRY